VNRDCNLSAINFTAKPKHLVLRVRRQLPPNLAMWHSIGSPAVTAAPEFVTKIEGRIDCPNEVNILQRRLANGSHYSPT